jgi:hypothetical protein
MVISVAGAARTTVAESAARAVVSFMLSCLQRIEGYSRSRKLIERWSNKSSEDTQDGFSGTTFATLWHAYIYLCKFGETYLPSGSSENLPMPTADFPRVSHDHHRK